MRVTAAVAREEAQPFVIEELELDDPRHDEVLVDIESVGLCHTDLAARDHWVSVPLPAVLGHEGAGVVRSVGAEVSRVRPGDRVVLTFGSCGRCGLCASGHPAYCTELLARNFGGCR